MGKTLVKIMGKSLKDKDVCEDLATNKVNPDMVEHVENAKDEIGKRMEVKEDLVKSEKKGNFTTENSMKSNLKKLRCICFINMTISSIILLPIIFNIKSVFLDKADRFPFTFGHCSTDYAASCPRPSFQTESCRSFYGGQTYSDLRPFPVSVHTKTIRATYHHSFLVSYPMRIAVSPGKVHQVFLNFRGEQLRYNFVSHLSIALQRNEIKFFIDNYEQRGIDLENLFLRIEESSIALAIFSTRFAFCSFMFSISYFRYPESSWCMDELVKMKKLADQGKLRVLPIFYNVEAGDVSEQKGEFGENFWNKAKTASGEQIKEWKEALESISNKMGLSLGENSLESDFLEEIVEKVQKVIDGLRKRRLLLR